MAKKRPEEKNIEEICKAYPDVPITILLKTDLLRVGVNLSQSALQAIQGMDIMNRDYAIFRWAHEEAKTVAITQKIPSDLIFKKDDTTLQFRMNTNSPYIIDLIDNKFVLCDERLGRTAIEEVYFANQPKSLHKTLPDGTPYSRILWGGRGPHALFIFLLYFCEFWKTGEQCLFCDSGITLKEGKGKGLKRLGRVSPEVVAKVTREVYDNEPQLRHLSINGGTILDAEKETDFYCSYLNALNEAWGGVWYPTWFQVAAREEKYIKRIHETGVSAIHLNLEVWDERMFNIICPGKAKFIGREEWIRRAIKAAEIFGRQNLLVNFVAGVEMAQPWGFKDPHEAVQSTLQGFEFLMAHDVLPRLDFWAIVHGSSLHDQRPPPLQYYIELGKGFLELMEKYNFRFPNPGHCRMCSDVSAEGDWWHYFHREEPIQAPARKRKTLRNKV